MASLSAKGAGSTRASESLLEELPLATPKVTAASVVLQSETRERECELRCFGADIMLRSLHVYGACGTNATLSKKNGQPDLFTIVLRRMTASPMLFIFVLMDSGLLTVKRRYLQRVT